MDLPIENLLHRSSIEYLVLDDTLHITDISNGVARLSHDPASVRLGSDVRLGFPELVGAEQDL